MEAQLDNQLSLVVIFCIVVQPPQGFRAAVPVMVYRGLSWFPAVAAFIGQLVSSHSPSQFVLCTGAGVVFSRPSKNQISVQLKTSSGL